MRSSHLGATFSGFLLTTFFLATSMYAFAMDPGHKYQPTAAETIFTIKLKKSLNMVMAKLFWEDGGQDFIQWDQLINEDVRNGTTLAKMLNLEGLTSYEWNEDSLTILRSKILNSDAENTASYFYIFRALRRSINSPRPGNPINPAHQSLVREIKILMAQQYPELEQLRNEADANMYYLHMTDEEESAPPWDSFIKQSRPVNVTRPPTSSSLDKSPFMTAGVSATPIKLRRVSITHRQEPLGAPAPPRRKSSRGSDFHTSSPQSGASFLSISPNTSPKVQQIDEWRRTVTPPTSFTRKRSQELSSSPGSTTSQRELSRTSSGASPLSYSPRERQAILVPPFSMEKAEECLKKLELKTNNDRIKEGSSRWLDEVQRPKAPPPIHSLPQSSKE